MFPMHEHTRRTACLLTFVALGVFPTVGVACWCMARHLPGRAAAEADVLSRELGVRVTLGGLQYVRPGVVRYEDLQLIHPETNRLLWHCRTLEAAWTTADNAQGLAVPWLMLQASGGELDGESLDELQQVLQRVMQSRSSLVEPYVRLAAGDVTLQGGATPQALGDVQAVLMTHAAGVQAQLCFRVPGVTAAEPVRISLDRNRQTSPPTVRAEFATGGAPLPCKLLSVALPEVGRLGPRSRFQGYVWASHTIDGWQGEVAGQFSEIDFDGLLGDWSWYKLSGSGQMTIQVARFRRGRVEEASGLLDAGPGSVSRALLSAATERLGLTRGLEPVTPGDLVPYEQLALAFLLDGQGLRVQGRCPTMGPGSVMVDRYGRLLGDPPTQPLPAAALVQTLAPADGFAISANRQSQRLLSLLPMPDSAPQTASRPRDR